MPSDRQLIDTDKAVLRRKYANDSNGLAELKAYAGTLYEDSPSDVELTGTSREGVTGSGQISNNLRLRRMAVEELIAERDPDYVAPPRFRSMGSVVRMGYWNEYRISDTGNRKDGSSSATSALSLVRLRW
jgi:hypothetical protein